MTIAQSGVLAGGTARPVSRIRLNLDRWYGQDSRAQRVGKMFCPVHAAEGLVDGVRNNLGDSSKLGGCPADAETHAQTYGHVGHSQKSAMAREDERPMILRRDFDPTDGAHAGLHFVSLQRAIDDFVETREAMNSVDLATVGAIGQRTNNGFRQYMTVQRRGNNLIPPRSHRSLPPVRP